MTEHLLLDTHALLWALGQPARLPRGLAARLRNPATTVFVSAVSTWEIAIKTGLGQIAADLGAIVTESRAAQFDELPITIAHTARVRSLPSLHRDPFDRLLIAQALEEGLALVTRDRQVTAYDVPVVWR